MVELFFFTASVPRLLLKKRPYYVYGMVHIKDLLLIIGKSSPCSGSSRFAL